MISELPSFRVLHDLPTSYLRETKIGVMAGFFAAQGGAKRCWAKKMLGKDSFFFLKKLGFSMLVSLKNELHKPVLSESLKSIRFRTS